MRDNLDGDFIICKNCGKREYTPDYFAQESKKYCRECAKIIERENTAERMRRFRKRAREKRADERKELSLTQERVMLLEQENEALKYMIKAMREQLENFINPDLQHYNPSEQDGVELIRERNRKKNFY